MHNDDFTLEVEGLTFGVEVRRDDTIGAPWEEHDCHGPVSEWRHGREKSAGERVLCQDRGSYRFYDVRGALARAKREGWGLAPNALAALAKSLGRSPTIGEVRARAVESDFQHLRAWCEDRWYWVGVIVTLLDMDGNPTPLGDSLWGIESNATNYIREVAEDCARNIALQVGDSTEVREYHSWKVRA